MLTLALASGKASYGAKTQDGLGVRHEGARGKVRRGNPKNARNVTASWEVGPFAYQYLRAFYRTGIQEGSEPFIAKLVFPSADITQHKAQFVPGSFRLSSTTGSSFIVEAKLLVEKALQ